MAYLTELRQIRPGPGNWPKNMALWNDAPHPSIVLDEIDATLNSWAEAHDVFDRLQCRPIDLAAGSALEVNQEVTYQAHKAMTHLALRAINDRLMNTASSYPPAVFAWALLELWIRAKGRPTGYEIHLGQRVYLRKDGQGMGGAWEDRGHYLNNWVVLDRTNGTITALRSVDHVLERPDSWPLKGSYPWAAAVIRRECGLPEV